MLKPWLFSESLVGTKDIPFLQQKPRKLASEVGKNNFSGDSLIYYIIVKPTSYKGNIASRHNGVSRQATIACISLSLKR